MAAFGHIQESVDISVGPQQHAYRKNQSVCHPLCSHACVRLLFLDSDSVFNTIIPQTLTNKLLLCVTGCWTSWQAGHPPPSNLKPALHKGVYGGLYCVHFSRDYSTKYAGNHILKFVDGCCWSLISTYRKEVEEQPHMGHKFSQYYEGSWSMTVFHEEAEVADLGVPCSGGECSDFFYNCLLWQLLWRWQDGAAKMVKSPTKDHHQQFPFSGEDHLFSPGCSVNCNSDGCSFNIMQLCHRCTVYNSDQITKHMHTFINKQKATQCVFFLLLQLRLA